MLGLPELTRAAWWMLVYPICIHKLFILGYTDIAAEADVVGAGPSISIQLACGLDTEDLPGGSMRDRRP